LKIKSKEQWMKFFERYEIFDDFSSSI
jgi:hypothetical protein